LIQGMQRAGVCAGEQADSGGVAAWCGVLHSRLCMHLEGQGGDSA